MNSDEDAYLVVQKWKALSLDDSFCTRGMRDTFFSDLFSLTHLLKVSSLALVAGKVDSDQFSGFLCFLTHQVKQFFSTCKLLFYGLGILRHQEDKTVHITHKLLRYHSVGTRSCRYQREGDWLGNSTSCVDGVLLLLALLSSGGLRGHRSCMLHL